MRKTASRRIAELEAKLGSGSIPCRVVLSEVVYADDSEEMRDRKSQTATELDEKQFPSKCTRIILIPVSTWTAAGEWLGPHAGRQLNGDGTPNHDSTPAAGY